MEQQNIDLRELLTLLGDKEVQLAVARRTIELQKLKIAELEAQLTASTTEDTQ